METVFDIFGGIRPMADHLSEAPSTVQGWKTAGRIPAGKQPDVLAKAEELSLDVTAEDVIFPLRPRARFVAPVHADTVTTEVAAAS